MQPDVINPFMPATAPLPQADWLQRKFTYRARALFYARLMFLTIGFGILAIPKWSEAFGVSKPAGYFVFAFMVAYSFANYASIERNRLGTATTFVTLVFDIFVVVYMIGASGGLRSPVLPTQIIFTILFALLFPKPMAILPPLLALPLIVRIDHIVYERQMVIVELFILIYYSALNVIVVYVIVYLSGREEEEYRARLMLQSELGRVAVIEERHRISREMHDGVGAALSGLVIQAEYLADAEGDAKLKGEIQELRDAAQGAMDELRRSLSLMNDDFDLVPAVEDYCHEFARRHGLKLDVSVLGRPSVDLRERALTVFRVLQESLTNVVKHAHAQAVRVSLTFLSDRAELVVEDDGRGFVVKPELKGHYGLKSMSERARAAAGEFEVTSEPGHGTRVRFAFPIGGAAA